MDLLFNSNLNNFNTAEIPDYRRILRTLTWLRTEWNFHFTIYINFIFKLQRNNYVLKKIINISKIIFCIRYFIKQFI